MRLNFGLPKEEVISVIIMDDQEKPFSEKQMIVKGLFALAFVPLIFIGFCVLVNEFVVKTPLVRSFDDAAKQSQIIACESEKGYKDTADCYK